MKNTFLSAEWRKLILANYAVDPSLLIPYLPYKTELDIWNDTCYASMVGFRFINTKIKGIRVPLHTTFEEVNLRFYVRYKIDGEWRRGAVFIQEIVPKRAVTWAANVLFKEHYVTLPMAHNWDMQNDRQRIEYFWSKDNVWNSMSVDAGLQAMEMPEGSEAEFITEHYYGYTRINDTRTDEYSVQHPRWQVYNIHDYALDIHFKDHYGPAFDFLSHEKPKSVMLAEGSAIRVGDGRRI